MILAEAKVGIVAAPQKKSSFFLNSAFFPETHLLLITPQSWYHAALYLWCRHLIPPQTQKPSARPWQPPRTFFPAAKRRLRAITRLFSPCCTWYLAHSVCPCVRVSVYLCPCAVS